MQIVQRLNGATETVFLRPAHCVGNETTRIGHEEALCVLEGFETKIVVRAGTR